MTAHRNDLFSFLESAELSDVGRRRHRNEDSVCRAPEAGVFCVADGMGGEDSGDIASQMTVRSIREALGGELSDWEAASADAKRVRLMHALESASQAIQQRAAQRGRGLSGSTVVVLVFDAVKPSQALALHAGDSRLYRFRDGDLEQITRDHSLAEEAGFAKKQLPKAFRGMVTRGVGIRDQLDLETTRIDVREKDLFLICSDGLSGMVPDRKLRKLLGKHGVGPLPELARILVQEANDAGGEDNVSVVIVRLGALKAVDIQPPAVPEGMEKPTEVTRPLAIPPPSPSDPETETEETPVPGSRPDSPARPGTLETVKRPVAPGFFARLAGGFRKSPDN